MADGKRAEEQRENAGTAGYGGRGAGHAEEEREETTGKLLKKDARQRRRGAEKHHAILQALLENGCVSRGSPQVPGTEKCPLGGERSSSMSFRHGRHAE